MAVQYDRAGVYLESKTTIAERLAAVDAIIDALLIKAAESPSTANYQEYYLDDGQTRISTKYRSAADVAAAIEAFEKMATRYRNQLNGHVFRLVDGKNFIGRCD